MTTAEQINTWTQEGKAPLTITLEGKTIYIQDPETHQDYFHMMKRSVSLAMQHDLVGAGEVIFNTCYLGGLGPLKQIPKDKIYLSACLAASNQVEMHKGTFTPA